MTPVKFQIAFDVFGLDSATTGRLWHALCRSAHPLAKTLWWTFVREEGRPAAGFSQRLAAVLLTHTPQEWSTMLEHLVSTGRLNRPDANAVLECLLTLVSAEGTWR